MNLLEHKAEFTEESTEELEVLLGQYYQDAEDGWKRIMDEIDRENDFNEEHFRILRKVIDLDLEEFKEFDASVNNYHAPKEKSN